jgi:hypothetical protein
MDDGRKTMRRTALVGAGMMVILGLTLVTVAMGQGEVVSGTITAVRNTEPPFQGYWRYCLTISWDTNNYGGKPHGVSHFSLPLGLGSCKYICETGYVMFADTAGSSVAASGCTAYYYGDFNCKGDPSISLVGPTVKFEPYGSGCEPGIVGIATMCFYSPVAPGAPGTYANGVWIKFGLNKTYGPLVGQLPGCASPVIGTEASTWGGIKALFGP